MILAISTVTGETASAANEDEIVIEGKRAAEETAATARALVRELGLTLYDRQVARWHRPICAQVYGLTAAESDAVARRIQLIAESLGAGLAGQDCSPNLSVLFSHDPDEDLRVMKTSRPSLFADVPPTKRDALFAPGRPIRWWYVIERRGENGRRLMSEQPAFIGRTSSGKSVLGAREGTTFGKRWTSTLLSEGGRRTLRAASAVIDLEQVGDLPLRGLADHAALVTLAEFGIEIPPSRGSVLGLFEEDGAQQLSPWDYSVLQAIYAVDRDRSARAQRSRMVSELVELRDGD
ncbi:hypothetical protein B5C34_04800 [Pacificimonas flava]|uniref:Uncharacterized protein n=2 Tax=Pacificimonas TaxID=1960290 RepID=A0A219B4Z4_9SPHN|nr:MULTISPECIES: hypothetical protein [Pacificimonas]MBZ6377463.1 hypothetical protein [Pacificimonas aurantium]OWV32838.1 hypothetical protein B5C34_04800 [Pacificimonas flava]